jgi:hypothetical protein
MQKDIVLNGYPERNLYELRDIALVFTSIRQKERKERKEWMESLTCSYHKFVRISFGL